MWAGGGIVLNSSQFSLSSLTNAYGLETIFVGIVWFFVFIWLISIIRVAKDISARTNSTLLQIVSILLVTLFTPLIGLPLYKIIKPIGFKKDNLPWREACASNLIACHNCSFLNPKEYECCIQCGEKLKLKCKQCGKQYPHTHHYCSHCWAPNIEL